MRTQKHLRPYPSGKPETKAYDEEAAIWLWRCINCGDRFDDTIRFHRALPKPPEPRHDAGLPTFDPERLLAAMRTRLDLVVGRY